LRNLSQPIGFILEIGSLAQGEQPLQFILNIINQEWPDMQFW
jgi:hypothetical protein